MRDSGYSGERWFLSSRLISSNFFAFLEECSSGLASLEEVVEVRTEGLAEEMTCDGAALIGGAGLDSSSDLYPLLVSMLDFLLTPCFDAMK